MIEEMRTADPRVLSREELSGLAGVTPSGGSFASDLSAIRTVGVAEVSGDRVRAADELFGSGRRASRGSARRVAEMCS
jgi:hypothetical protein